MPSFSQLLQRCESLISCDVQLKQRVLPDSVRQDVLPRLVGLLELIQEDLVSV